MRPSQPSFCTPGRPAEELVGHVLAEALLAQALALDLEQLLAAARVLPSALEAAHAEARERARRGCARGCGRGARPRAIRASGVTMRHEARLSSAVPHSTAFLPPAFIATLPPMHEASADVGSTANTRPCCLGRFHHALGDDARAAADRRRHGLASRPGSTRSSTASSASSFSVFTTARRRRSSGIAPPVYPGAAAARDDGEAEVDQRAARSARTPPRCPGCTTTNGILDAPVGGVGHVRDARHAVERRCCRVRVMRREPAHDLAAQRCASRRTRSRRRPRPCARASSSSATLRVAVGFGLVARGACRSRAGGGASPRPAVAGGAGCRGGRPAGTGLRRTTQMSPSTS